MKNRLADIQQRVKNEHKDIVKYVQHVFDALDQNVNKHRMMAASDALAGIKIKGAEEKAYYESITEIKKLMLDVLEQTTADIEHLGDKGWNKNFKDGVKD
jgi:hypothetical protein